MISENITFEKKESQQYEALPENIYQVELLDVNVENRPTYDTRNKPDEEKVYEKVLNFQFTLLSGTHEGKSLRGRNVWENFVSTYLYISSKHGKNKLYEVVEGLIGRSLKPEEEARGITSDQINGLIGSQVRVGVKNRVVGDKTYDRIEQYYPVEMQMNALTADEKDKARVKSKEEKVVEQATQVLGGMTVKDEEIPVVNVEKDMTMHQGDNQADSNGAKLEEAPF